MADTLPESWVAYIKPFADAIGKTVEETTDALKDTVGEPCDEAISMLQDESLATFEELKSKLGDGVPTAKFKKAVAGLRKVAAPPSVPMAPMFATSVLPPVPSDDNWLSALKVGGILNFGKETVSGTVSAALAQRAGLYDLPRKIVEEMERYAENIEDSVPKEFFALQKSLTERSYGDLFAAIPGMSGKYATQKRKDALLQKMDDNLWKSLIGFQSQLKGWFTSLREANNDAFTLSEIFTTLASGGLTGIGSMPIPPTDPLKTAAEAVVSSINKIFAGTGAVVAAALAFDAQQIRLALTNDKLHLYVGAANRDEMLRKLKATVTSDYVSLEANLKQYVLGIIDLKNQTPGRPEYEYIKQLYQLGCSIPWDKLTENVVSTPSDDENPSGRNRKPQRF